jgi:hypothetical protein
MESAIQIQHRQFVADLIKCAPHGERARELRVMIRRLEAVAPELEQERIGAMQAHLGRVPPSLPAALAGLSGYPYDSEAQ